MLENLKRLDICFVAIFEYLQRDVEVTVAASTTEFTAFLVWSLRGLQLLDIAV
jgi:hypothetical protein